mgnify:CR=1 FL=1
MFLVDNKDLIDDIYKKYAFDIKLLRGVYDNVTKEETYTDFDNATSFIAKYIILLQQKGVIILLMLARVILYMILVMFIILQIVLIVKI